MRLLKLAATSSLAALMVMVGADQLRATHDEWNERGGYGQQAPWSNSGQSWSPRQPAQRSQPYRVSPDNRGNAFFNWFQPQVAVPRSQNIEPEPPPAKAPVIYTYRADPLVELADSNLERSAVPAEQERRWQSRRQVSQQVSQAVFEALKSGSAGVRVTEQQREDIVAFYRQRDFAPVWLSPAGDAARARDLLSELAEAEAHGLVPQDYLPTGMMTFSDDVTALAGDHQRLAQLDLALTAAALRYAMHASGGRVIPSRISAYHDLAPPTVEGRQALAQLASQPSPSAYLASLHPVHPAYEAFREALAELRARNDGDEEPIAEGRVIKPGEADARIPAIRARLAKLGHLAPAAVSHDAGPAVDDEFTASIEEAANPIVIDGETPIFGNYETVVIVEAVMPETPDVEPRSVEPRYVETPDGEPLNPDLLDERTVLAIKAFQADVGVTVDGIIGPQTIAALNSGTTEERLRRLVYNMERLRWLPRDFGAKHIFVNAAAFETQVVEDGRTIWQSKVIVGTPQNQTVFFSDEMDTVVFNPYWGVPGSIIVHEMLPEARRDPYWFDREGYEVVDQQGRVIPASSVNWYNINTSKLPIGVRQPPGPNNALGELKFLFPNEHAIYMHDTPSKPLFERASRAFSHGCVRVQNPRRFAELVLGWDQERIATTLASTRNHSVEVDTAIPVHITYFTAWPDESGSVRYYGDVYGRDQLLERAFGMLVLAMR
jgi:L,D-transpeptidase YcbB